MGIYAVTGAASGIGQAVARQLQAKGNEVITVDIRDADITADLSDSSQCQSVIEAIREKAPDGLDGFVPCAGLGPDCKDITLVPRVNYFAVVDLVDGLLPLLANRNGVLVLISSNSSRIMEYSASYMDALLADDREKAVQIVQSLDGQAAYGGGKQALSRWMRRNIPEFSKAGVRANAVAPGYTESGMTKGGLEDPNYADAIQDFINTIPVGRKGVPDDQANAITFLLSEQASFISGSILFVDGGHDAVFRPDSY